MKAFRRVIAITLLAVLAAATVIGILKGVWTYLIVTAGISLAFIWFDKKAAENEAAAAKAAAQKAADDAAAENEGDEKPEPPAQA